MANEDDTRQITVDGQVFNELVLAVRELSTRYTNQEERLNSVEQIILARLNDTRPFEHQMMARLNEMDDKINKFREETNGNFRKMRKVQELLNEDHIHIRAEHSFLETRVEHLEDRAA